jgi:hypothetical protein
MSTIRINSLSCEGRDAKCIGRTCLRLGRGYRVVRTSKGFEELAHGELCCVTREKQGCPKLLPCFDDESARARERELARARRHDNWLRYLIGFQNSKGTVTRNFEVRCRRSPFVKISKSNYWSSDQWAWAGVDPFGAESPFGESFL